MTTGPTDHSGMEILESAECFRLLASVPIGRVAYVADGAPRIFPVTFGVSENHIAYRSGAGSKLDAAEMARPIAFEVDDWDEAQRTGWSVVASGRVHTVTDEDRVAQLEDLDVDPWLSGEEMEWVEITIDEISGRRLPG